MKEIVFTRRFEHDFRRLKRKIPHHALDYETLEYAFELLQAEKGCLKLSENMLSTANSPGSPSVMWTRIGS